MSGTVGGWVRSEAVLERHANGEAVGSVAWDGEQWVAEVKAPGSPVWHLSGRFAELDDATGEVNSDLLAFGWDA